MGVHSEETMAKWIERYLRWLSEEKGRTPRTIGAYQFELGRFVSYLEERGVRDWSEVDREQVRDFLSGLGPTNGPKARTRTLSVVRSLYAYLLREGWVIQDPTSGIDFPKVQKKDPSPLSGTQIQHLLGVVNQYATRGSLLRDRAILLLFLGTGIRLSGLVHLNREDVDLEERVIRVRRKGGKEQIVELNHTVADALRRYDQTQPGDREAFFLSTRRGRVHRAIEHIITEKGLPVQNPILFSIYEILKVLNLSNRGGANYRKVRETIRRIVHTGIDSEGAFYCKNEDCWILTPLPIRMWKTCMTS